MSWSSEQARIEGDFMRLHKSLERSYEKLEKRERQLERALLELKGAPIVRPVSATGRKTKGE